MAITRGDARTLIQQYLDDPNAARWTATNIDIALDEIYYEGHSELIDAAPYINSTRTAVAVANITAPGYIDVTSALTRFYRIQKLTREDIEYSPADEREFALDEVDGDLIVGASRRYFFLGDQLWMTPLDDTENAADIRYSALPVAWSSLANDSTDIVWPEGHINAFILKAAVTLMGKGAAEDTDPLSKMANRAWNRVLRYVRRRYPGPRRMYSPGHSRDFGSMD